MFGPYDIIRAYVIVVGIVFSVLAVGIAAKRLWLKITGEDDGHDF